MLSLELPGTGRDEWTGAESTVTLQGFIGKGQVRRRCVRSLGSRGSAWIMHTRCRWTILKMVKRFKEKYKEGSTLKGHRK